VSADEKLFAWLDGELSGADAAEVEARVARDPELQRLVDEHRAMQAGLRSAFDPLIAAPVPDRVADLLRPPESKVVDLHGARSRREARRWTPVAQWGSMAATLAIGLMIGSLVPRGPTAPVEIEGGRMLAAAQLHQALDTQLASAPADKAGVGVPLTFRDQSGTICRSFVEPGASGLACRSGDRWQVRGLFAAPEGQAGDYRMAAGTDPQLMTLIEQSIDGAPFDARGEQAALERQWR
jgi:hypothetical protein